jgi:exonuclease III
MAARSRRTERSKALRLASWNMDEVRGRKRDMEHFLNQHCVDICLLSEILVIPRQDFRVANCVCHRT